MKNRNVRVWTYLTSADYQFVNRVQNVLGLESRSDTIRFIIRLCRLLIPKANIVADVVNNVLTTEEMDELIRERKIKVSG